MKAASKLEKLINHTLFSAHHKLRDRLQLHIRRTFVDGADLAVSPEFFDGIVLYVTIAAEEFDSFA